MSSTDGEELDLVVDSVVWDSITRLANQYKTEGRVFFATRPSFQPSYFSHRTRRVMAKEDFKYPSCDSCDELASKLSEMWNADELPELAALAADFASLATKIHSSGKQQEGELSPFIYVMF